VVPSSAMATFIADHQASIAEEQESLPLSVISQAIDGAVANHFASESGSIAVGEVTDSILVGACAECKSQLASVDDEGSSHATTTGSDVEHGNSDTEDSESCKASSDVGMATSSNPGNALESAQDSDSDVSVSRESCASCDAELDTHTFSAAETVIIFDWDDTILPSSWVQSEGMRLDNDFVLSAQQQEQLAAVATAAIETLTFAKKFGTVLLITNAEKGWIELSCTKFMPMLVPALEDVSLISARTSYESASCLQPTSWKICAFEAELGRIFGPDTEIEMRKNVLSLGDSIHEREALVRTTSFLTNCRAKNLKFMDRPSPIEIRKQHELIAGCFEDIVHHDGVLDLCVRC